MSIPWKQPEIDTMLTLAQQGLTLNEISRRLGGKRSPDAVKYQMYMHGIKDAHREPQQKCREGAIRSWSSMAPHEQASMRRWLVMEDGNG